MSLSGFRNNDCVDGRFRLKRYMRHRLLPSHSNIRMSAPYNPHLYMLLYSEGPSWCRWLNFAKNLDWITLYQIFLILYCLRWLYNTGYSSSPLKRGLEEPTPRDGLGSIFILPTFLWSSILAWNGISFKFYVLLSLNVSFFLFCFAQLTLLVFLI